MPTSRGARLDLGAEVALAFACGLAFFAAVAVPLVLADRRFLPVVGLGIACIAGVVAILRFWGVAYAVAVAVASLLAYDWFYVPPLHPHAFPDAESLVDLLVFLAVGAVVGVLAARAGRRAETSEVARSELASEQAALRRVATLVADGVPPNRVFATVAQEATTLLDVDGAWIEFYEGEDVVNAAEWSRPGKTPPTFDRGRVEDAPVAAAVRRSGGVERVDDFESIQPTTGFTGEPRVMSLVGAPIMVEGDLWGLLLAWAPDAPLPQDAEAHLTAFTELVGTAISNAAARAQMRRLADEQAALRRVATLVAEGPPPPEVFAAVAREVGLLLGVDRTHMGRYESDGTAVGVGSWSADGTHSTVGTVAPVDGTTVTGMVHESGRPERMESYERASSPSATILRELGIRSSVGAPIVVDGRLWGVMIASSKAPAALPADTESRIAGFTELVATAISNTESRNETRRLAEEQAALRSVATAAVEGVPPSELFGAVVGQVGLLFGADLATLLRYEDEETAELVATWTADGVPLDGPRTWSMADMGLPRTIPVADWPTRVDDWTEMSGGLARYVREVGVTSSVGSAIMVEGRLWGALAVHSHGDPVPAGTELRLGQFTALAATAISNSQSWVETRRLADEQAALRRVATLVAESAPPDELFGAVAAEVGGLLGANLADITRCESDGTVTAVAGWPPRGGADRLPGRRWPLEGGGTVEMVAKTGRPVRIDDYEGHPGVAAEYLGRLGVVSSVGAPIVVDGQLWGVLNAHSTDRSQPLPADAESRTGEFTELVATAVANSQARSDLAASRARIVAAADDERRRVVRDLHDGAQQRLVHTVVTLNMARTALEGAREDAADLVSESLQHAEEATAELRELAHGILPSVLTRGGLRAGIGALASRMPVPVETSVSVDRLPPAIEATAYFVVAEALTNVTKHASADHAAVVARMEDEELRVQVSDDGVGGAREDGSGLLGLGDRLAVLDGRLHVESPADGGTRVVAAIPIRSDSPRQAPHLTSRVT